MRISPYRAAEAEAARLAAIRQQQQADCHQAQTFASLEAVFAQLPPGQLPGLGFPHPQRFELRNKMWGFGDASVTGPGGLPWFRMVRTNRSVFREMFKNANFCITTMAGEPLLVLQEQRHVPICRITRQWTLFAFTDRYSIQLHRPMLNGAQHMACEGRWPNQFTLHNGTGTAYMTVDKQMFSWTDKYHVTIAAQQDVLLMIGIACAIDRIHHEVEDKRRRRGE
eukprot:gene4737-45527_t